VIIKAAPAKINLALHVTARRADGYHLLDSLVVFTGTGDALSLEPAEKTSLDVSGPFAGGLTVNDDNLILQAFRAIETATGKALPSTRFALTKNLPVSSGIGGGSADAAAALNGLDELWDRQIPKDQLNRIGLGLGADVPVCLKSITCRLQGIGEKISSVNGLAPMALLLVNPGVAISTPQIFQNLALPQGQPAFQALPALPTTGDFQTWLNWLGQTRNDLQPPAIAQSGKISEVLAALSATSGCHLARMSGSGATCFGIYQNLTEAQQAAAEIKSSQPEWWVSPTDLLHRV
jgi:4-diphosphocytidyl-2-C-methyl-D-erythritol kinase